MKTETQIAEENLKSYKEEVETWGTPDTWKVDIPESCFISQTNCESHKASCERFLGFLESLVGVLRTNKESSMKIEEKITDLKQAIKLYDDTGI